MSLSRLIGYWHYVAPACYDINQLENITEEKTIQFAHFETKFNNQTGLHFILAKLWEDLSNLKYLVTDCCKRWLREDKSLIFFTCSAILDFNYYSDKTPSLPVVCLMIVVFVCCQFTGFPFMLLSLLVVVVVVWGCGGISRLSVTRGVHIVICLFFVCLFTANSLVFFHVPISPHCWISCLSVTREVPGVIC